MAEKRTGQDRFSDTRAQCWIQVRRSFAPLWITAFSGMLDERALEIGERIRLTRAYGQLKRRFFWVLSRSALAVYRRLPLFGRLHASVGVIRKDQLVLVIDRSDGRGLSFPGGFAMPWETAEHAMKREVAEETGLQVQRCTPLFEYRSSADFPVVLAVFAAEADGELKDSWEGSPRWLPFTEIRPRLLPSQKEIVDRLL